MKSPHDLIDPNQNFFTMGILPHHNYRFVIARNTAVAREVGRRHNASLPVTALFGEVMLGAFFLSTHSGKQEETTISLHIECQEPVSRIIGFAKSSGGMRAHSTHPDAVWDGALRIGRGTGLLRVNRWIQNTKKLYSSAIEMRDVDLDKNLEEYIGRSEQIQSFLKISTNFSSIESLQISGYLFQAMPGASADDTDAVLDIIQRNRAEELIEEILSSGKEEKKKIVKGSDFLNASVLRTGQFYSYCDCSREKIAHLIQSMDAPYVESILEEHGFFEATCEFCKKSYRFTPEQVRDLYQEEGG